MILHPDTLEIMLALAFFAGVVTDEVTTWLARAMMRKLREGTQD